MKPLHGPLLILSIGSLLACVQPARADFVSEVLGDNPAGFWILNENTAAAADSSGNGFHGTYGAGVTRQGIAGPSWVSGPGLVASLSGTTGGNVTFDDPMLLGLNGYSIQAWINPTLSSVQNTSRIASSGFGLDGYSFGTTAGGELIFTSFALQDYTTTTLNLLPGQWYYVGVVLDIANDANFYVNGTLVQTVPGLLPTLLATRDFTIGSRSPGLLDPPDQFFSGGLAGISVYSTALTATQILSQYNAAIIPEPSSFVLIGLAAIGAGCTLRPRRRKTP